MGLAVGLGCAVGAALKGVATFGITVGQALSIASSVNFIAGIGAYAIENAGAENFNWGNMLMSGFSQTGKVLVNFTLAGLLVLVAFGE